LKVSLRAVAGMILCYLVLVPNMSTGGVEGVGGGPMQFSDGVFRCHWNSSNLSAMRFVYRYVI